MNSLKRRPYTITFVFIITLLLVNNKTYCQDNKDYDAYTKIENIILSKDTTHLKQILKENNLDYNSVIYDVTPIFLACHKPDSIFINWLLEQGASPNIISRYGTVGNWLIEKESHLNIFNMLLDYGFDPNIESMQYWKEKELTNPEEVPEWLKKSFKKINEHNLKTEHLPYFAYNDPADGLILAASIYADSTLTLTKRLLEYDLDVNMIDKKGITPLLTAIHFCNMEAIQLLIKHGANVNQALEPPIMDMYKNNPDFTDQLTPLILFMKNLEEKPDLINNKETINTLKILLKAGADASFQTVNSKITALDIAQSIHNKEILHLIKKYSK